VVLLDGLEAEMKHELKTLPEFFSAIVSGDKNFEIRRNDRLFNVGDVLRLREFEPTAGNNGDYTGKAVEVRVSYITEWNQKPGYIVMAIKQAWEK
jgi:hypothetical protein